MGSESIHTRWAAKLVGDSRRIVRAGEKVAPADIDLVSEGDGDGLSGLRRLQVARGAENARHRRGFAGRARDDLRPTGDPAGSDIAAEAAEVGGGAIDPLHRQAEGQIVFPVNLDGFEDFHQGRAAVPGRGLAGREDVVAMKGGERHRADVGDAELPGESGEVRGNVVEYLPVPADQVHLVDGEDRVADAEKRDDIAVPPGLGQHALAGVDQDDREVGARRAGRHVAGVLFVARGVGGDELAPVGLEEAVGDIDRDALFALRLQTVDQQRQVDGLALGAVFAALGAGGGKLVFEDGLRVVKQPAQKGGFAVVHGTAGDEAELVLGVLGGEEAVDVGDTGRRRVHQK